MDSWTDKELEFRWKVVAKDYFEKAKQIAPLLQKLNNLEKELDVLRMEFEKRGIKISETEE